MGDRLVGAKLIFQHANYSQIDTGLALEDSSHVSADSQNLLFLVNDVAAAARLIRLGIHRRSYIFLSKGHNAHFVDDEALRRVEQAHEGQGHGSLPLEELDKVKLAGKALLSSF